MSKVGVVNLNDGRFNYHYKGFTSIINQVVELCLYHYEKNKNLNINVSDHRIENFFNLSKIDYSNDNFYTVSDNYLSEFLISGHFKFPNYNAHNVVSEKDVELRNFIFTKIFTLKNDIIFDNKNFDIGIQIRGTDKINELPEITKERVIEKINFILQQTPNAKNIFVSTDEYKYKKIIDDAYGKNLNIVYYDNITSYDGTPIHFNNDKKNIDFEVLRDVYMLSKCENLIYCYSNVSLLAIMLNNNKFKNKLLLND